MTARAAALLAVFALLCGGASAGAATPPLSPPPGAAAVRELQGGPALGDFARGEVVVRFRRGVSARDRRATLAANGARLARTLRGGGSLVRIGLSAAPPKVAAALARDPDVLWAEPNWVYRAAAVPDDPRFPELWALESADDRDIDAPEAWEIGRGGPGVVVAVVDSGIAYDHPDLAPTRG